MILQSEHRDLTLASNSGRSCASYRVVLVSGSSRAIVLLPPLLPDDGVLLFVEHAAATRAIAATPAISPPNDATRLRSNLPTSCSMDGPPDQGTPLGYPNPLPIAQRLD